MARNVQTDNFEPDIIVLYCQHCVSEHIDDRQTAKTVSGFRPRFVLMPCSSKVEPAHMLKLLDTGADGVQVVGCAAKQCRFLVGSAMAEKRVEYTRGLLDEIRIGADRLGMERTAPLTAVQLTKLAEQRAATVRPLGPNPMKGTQRQ